MACRVSMESGYYRTRRSPKSVFLFLKSPGFSSSRSNRIPNAFDQRQIRLKASTLLLLSNRWYGHGNNRDRNGTLACPDGFLFHQCCQFVASSHRPQPIICVVDSCDTNAPRQVSSKAVPLLTLTSKDENKSKLGPASHHASLLADTEKAGIPRRNFLFSQTDQWLLSWAWLIFQPKNADVNVVQDTESIENRSKIQLGNGVLC